MNILGISIIIYNVNLISVSLNEEKKNKLFLHVSAFNAEFINIKNHTKNMKS